jgi:hypothetical protein
MISRLLRKQSSLCYFKIFEFLVLMILNRQIEKKWKQVDKVVN